MCVCVCVRVCWRTYYVTGRSLRCSPGWGNPWLCAVMLYMGEGSKREQWRLLCSLQGFSQVLCYPQAKWALLGLCMFWDPMGLSNQLSYEAGSFSRCCLNPQGVFSQWFEALFLRARALGLCGLFCSAFVPPGLSVRECGTTGSSSHHFVGSASCSLACPIPQSATSLGLPATALL